MVDRNTQRALYDAMDEWIKKHVPEEFQTRWKEEANEWRLPYWDFARYADRIESSKNSIVNGINHDKIRLPMLCMMPSVRVNVFGADGKLSTKSRANPLYKYVTPKPMGEFPAPYNIKKETNAEVRNDDGTLVNPEFKFPVSPLPSIFKSWETNHDISSGINV